MVNFNNIYLIVVDVDSTLSDGIYQISSDGIITKSFHTRDFYAIEKILESEIRIVIISQSHDDIIIKQINRICSHSKKWDNWVNNTKWLSVFTAIDNKKEKLEELLEINYRLNWDNVSYMGDSENDLECMEVAGYTGCPADAIQIVKDNSNYVSTFPGGKGCVYEFIMYILDQKKRRKNESKTIV